MNSIIEDHYGLCSNCGCYNDLDCNCRECIDSVSCNPNANFIADILLDDDIDRWIENE